MKKQDSGEKKLREGHQKLRNVRALDLDACIPASNAARYKLQLSYSMIKEAAASSPCVNSRGQLLLPLAGLNEKAEPIIRQANILREGRLGFGMAEIMPHMDKICLPGPDPIHHGEGLAD